MSRAVLPLDSLRCDLHPAPCREEEKVAGKSEAGVHGVDAACGGVDGQTLYRRAGRLVKAFGEVYDIDPFGLGIFGDEP